MTKVGLERPVKLSCRSLWKVYGAQAERLVRNGGALLGRPRGACERLRRDGHMPAVIDASFDVHAGEIFVIMGLSGSGKSTLVRCLSRLIEPSAGQVLLDGEDLLAASPQRLIELRRTSMGMVFQHFGLLPHLTVLDNVAFPLRVQGMAVERAGRAGARDDRAGRPGGPRGRPFRISFPAASSSASALPARSRSGRSSGSSTSRSPRSTR